MKMYSIKPVKIYFILDNVSADTFNYSIVRDKVNENHQLMKNAQSLKSVQENVVNY